VLGILQAARLRDGPARCRWYVLVQPAPSTWIGLGGLAAIPWASGMSSPAGKSAYAGYQFPAEIISHTVWLAERGVAVTHESVRRGVCQAPTPAATTPRDTWHLDEVFIRVGGVLHYLWRAVDRHGVVLDILVQERRDCAAVKRFFRCLLKGLQYKPKRLIADGLRSYGVAQRALLPGVKHRISRYLNNRAENSHRPTRRHLGDRKRGEGAAGVYASRAH
jgi:putative transposase